MISLPKLSALATSLSLVMYAPWAYSTEVTRNYTIEFAQPASESAVNQVANTSTTQAAPVAPSNMPAPKPAPMGALASTNVPPSHTMYFGNEAAATNNQALQGAANSTTMYDMPQVSSAPNSTRQASGQPAAQDALDINNLERQARAARANGQTQYPAAPSQSMSIQYGLQDRSVPMSSASPANNASAMNASQVTSAQTNVAGAGANTATNAGANARAVTNTSVGANANATTATGVATSATAASTNNAMANGLNASTQGQSTTNVAPASANAASTNGVSFGETTQTEYEVEVIDSAAQRQQEAALRQGITDQAYPASVNENGTDDFYQSENARLQQSMQTPQNANMGQGGMSAMGQGGTVASMPNSNAGTSVAQGVNGDNPSFTFESAESNAQQKPSNVFPLGSHAVTTPDGRQIMVGPDGKPLLDSNGQPIPAPLEQIQEVSVMMLTTLDNALINAFKSLESGLTLGLGQNNHEYTLDNIAPALRGYSFDESGNLLVRFSVNSAESIIKRNGSLSWTGLSNPILVWMVGLDEVNHSNQLSLVSGQNLSTFAQAILNAAPDYKYRLMFPILDLEDVQKVKVGTVLNHQDDVLAEASKRYGSDYFISAAIDNVNDDGTGVALKWNLYNKKGELIAQSSLSGLIEEVASLGANDIARAVMTYQEELRKNPDAKPEDNTPSELNANNVDINRLGAGDGFIRIRVENVRALSDFQEMRKAFVTYGYDGDIRIVGYDNGAMILEVVTNSNIEHLEGTLRRAGDFTYLAPWTYQFNSTAAPRRSMQDSHMSSTTTTQPNKANVTQTANNEQVLIIRNY